ncbi:ABC transporter ATP-binding protein [Bifidobacterium vansinderenii]|uniref:ABC transporter ATP-binding component n=1 Tax=Bifidobacterium vansinderenii TaxID=1984871 RepID=A0A229W061_9BIFI|nr:ABC transporter ATP-binding protein [Bifidobacterium vansinderenii]OXN01263.1 ABC transporter ATP-binding component [Bifidobacterium vansinderenii]
MSITIRHLGKRYGERVALRDVNLEVCDGELVCLLGPSGCGKSTLLNIVAGLLDPSGGDVLIDGESVVRTHPKYRGIGMVFQDYALYPHMSVEENVMFPLRVGEHRVARREALVRARRFMRLTGIEDLARLRPGSLSGGQQQRVAVARALVQEPRVLLLDEPLSNLDARLRLSIREEIRRIVKATRVTTVFVTHDQEEALSIGDRIAVMDRGVIQQFAAPQDLYLDPANLFVARFMGSPVLNTFCLSYDGGRRVLAGDDFSVPLGVLDVSRFRRPVGEAESVLAAGGCVLGVRPEHFHLVGGSDGLADAGADRFPVVFGTLVESVEMIGRYAVVHFTADDERCRCVVDVRRAPRAGDRVLVGLDCVSVHVFDADGGRLY